MTNPTSRWLNNLHCIGLSTTDYYFLYFAAVTTIILAALRLAVEVLQVRYPVPMCVPLAVAVWSDSNLPGMDCTDCISPEADSHRGVCPHVYTHHPVLSESGIAGFALDNCIWTGILPAVF